MKYIITLLTIVGMLSLTSSAQNVQIEPPARKSAIVRLYDVATGRFFCSGAVVSVNIIVSAAHCMYDHPQGIEVKDKDGKFSGARVIGVRAHDRSDQAVLLGDFSMFEEMKIVTDPAAIVKLIKRNEMQACGFPYAGPLYCTKLDYKGIDVFQFKAHGAGWPGMSGGPVIDEDTGYIVGVITAMSGEDMILSPTINIFYNLGLEEVK